MKTIKNITYGIIGCLFACTSARALTPTVSVEDISSLNTGDGQYVTDTNANAPLTDPNWTVTLLTSTGTPPGGVPTGTAYLVPNNVGYPLNTTSPPTAPWPANDTTSQWITYSTPLNIAADTTNDTFQYQTTFTASDSGTVFVVYDSDNTDSLAVSSAQDSAYSGTYTAINGDTYPGTLLGSDGGTPFVFATDSFTVTDGDTYSVDLDVLNIANGANSNPTGARVEFTGVANNVPNIGNVPEPSTYILLGVGGLALFIVSRRRAFRLV